MHNFKKVKFYDREKFLNSSNRSEKKSTSLIFKSHYNSFTKNITLKGMLKKCWHFLPPALQKFDFLVIAKRG